MTVIVLLKVGWIDAVPLCCRPHYLSKITPSRLTCHFIFKCGQNKYLLVSFASRWRLALVSTARVLTVRWTCRRVISGGANSEGKRATWTRHLRATLAQLTWNQQSHDLDRKQHHESNAVRWKRKKKQCWSIQVKPACLYECFRYLRLDDWPNQQVAYSPSLSSQRCPASDSSTRVQLRCPWFPWSCDFARIHSWVTDVGD